MTLKIKPWAVLISDVHFNLKNLALSIAAMKQAIAKAIELRVPLIIAGDLLDQKAIIRGECANALIELLNEVPAKLYVYILVGNHDKINEKGSEHALNFLSLCANTSIVQTPVKVDGLHLIPYQTDPKEFENIIREILIGSTIIAHQGIKNSDSGDYIVDHSAIDRRLLTNYRVITGHYHKRQDIKCSRPGKGAVGLASYIGSPFTMTFAEANDPPKGFQILMEDGTLEHVPTNLRKHVILETTTDLIKSDKFSPVLEPEDLLWLKVKGPQSELKKLSKRELGLKTIGHNNYKLDLIPTESTKLVESVERLTGEQIFDKLIDATSDPEEHKKYLKELWREIL